MGFTNRDFPIVEIAIRVCSNPEFWRTGAGDIIAIRPPDLGVGTLEQHHLLWLRVEGLEHNEIWRLAEWLEESGGICEKRRFCIPLSRLKELDPSFDIAKATDLEQVYQPYLLVDEETGFYLTGGPIFDATEIVFDKLTGQWLDESLLREVPLG